MPSGYKLEINKGDIFHRLTIVHELPKKNGSRYFMCKCDCGTLKSIRLDSLTGGRTKSCGCYNLEQSKTRNIKHGMYKTRIYRTWGGMKQRCLSKTSDSYKHYGERGITVCKEWLEFDNFYRWAMANGYADHLTIERINNDGNYDPTNCTWITVVEQRRNTTRCQKILLHGKRKTLRQWAKYSGMSRGCLMWRLNKLGWSLEKAISEPVRGRK